MRLMTLWKSLRESVNHGAGCNRFRCTTYRDGSTRWGRVRHYQCYAIALLVCCLWAQYDCVAFADDESSTENPQNVEITVDNTEVLERLDEVINTLKPEEKDVRRSEIVRAPRAISITNSYGCLNDHSRAKDAAAIVSRYGLAEYLMIANAYNSYWLFIGDGITESYIPASAEAYHFYSDNDGWHVTRSSNNSYNINVQNHCYLTSLQGGVPLNGVTYETDTIVIGIIILCTCFTVLTACGFGRWIIWRK